MISIFNNENCIFCVDNPDGLCFRLFNSNMQQIAPENQVCVDFTDLPEGRYYVKAYNCQCKCEDREETDFYWNPPNAGDGNQNVPIN